MPRRNTVEIVIRGDDQATDVIRSALDNTEEGLRSIAGSLKGAGAELVAQSAPFAAAFTAAAKTAMDFDEAMTNAHAVLGTASTDMQLLNDEILAIGTNSRAGPQAAAEAFYDIVGGVSDASAHMAILEASIATAEAGSASLTGTTSALISVMNAYGFEAERAGFASDVLTSIVNAGVGTMDQFASALPKVSGLASTLNISFDELGGAMALITTGGASASEAATQLRGIMTMMLNPSADLAAVLADIGYESGTAAVEALGLAGTVQAIDEQMGGGAATAQLFGANVEALNGVLALTKDGSAEFLEEFSNSVDGATEAARAIQLGSAAAQLDMMRSAITALAIEVGYALLPHLISLMEIVRPMVQQFTVWAGEHPRLIAGAAALTLGAIVLGTTLIALGTAVGIVATGVAGLATAFAIVVNPIGLAVVAVGALATAWGTDFLNIRTTVTNSLNAIGLLFQGFAGTIHDFGIREALLGLFGEGSFDETNQSMLEGFLTQLGMDRDRAIAIVATLYEGVKGAIDPLAGAFLSVQDGIQSFTDGMDSGFSDVRSRVVQKIRDIVSSMSEMFTGFVSRLRGANIGEAIAGLLDGNLAESLSTIFTNAQAAISETLKSVEVLIINFVKATSGDMDKWATGAAAAIAIVKVAMAGVTGPLGMAILAVTWLKAAWDENLGGIQEKTAEVIDAIKTALDGGLPGILKAISTFGPELLKELLTGLGNIATWVQTNIIDELVSALTPGGDSLSTEISEWGPGLLEDIGTIVSDLAFRLGELPGEAGALLVAALPQLIKGVSNFAPTLLKGILAGFAAVGGIIVWVSTNIIAPFVAGLISGGVELVKAVATHGPDILKEILISLGDLAVWIVDNVITPLGDSLLAGGETLVAAVAEHGPDILAKILETLGELPEWVTTNIIVPLGAGLISGATTLIKNVATYGPDILKEILTGLGDLATWVFDNIITPIAQRLFAGAYDVAQSVINVAPDLLQEIIDGLGDLATWVFDKIIDPIVQALLGLPQAAADAVSNLGGELFESIIAGLPDIGQWISDNIGDPINSALNSITGGGPSGQMVTGANPDTTVHDLVNPLGGNMTGTAWTGSGPMSQIAGFHHNQEAVIPRSGMRVIPSPNGLMLDGGGGNTEYNINITVDAATVNDVANTEQNAQTLAQAIQEKLRSNG